MSARGVREKGMNKTAGLGTHVHHKPPLQNPTHTTGRGAADSLSPSKNEMKQDISISKGRRSI